GLCHVLSGGLARDLYRTTRELVGFRDAGGGIGLGEAALGLCRREGQARLRAVRHELMRDPFDAANIELLDRISELTPDQATAADFRRWHDELRSPAAGAAPAAPGATAAPD